MWDFLFGFLAAMPVYAGLVFALGVAVSRKPELSGKIMARVIRQMTSNKK